MKILEIIEEEGNLDVKEVSKNSREELLKADLATIIFGIVRVNSPANQEYLIKLQDKLTSFPTKSAPYQDYIQHYRVYHTGQMTRG